LVILCFMKCVVICLNILLKRSGTPKSVTLIFICWKLTALAQSQTITYIERHLLSIFMCILETIDNIKPWNYCWILFWIPAYYKTVWSWSWQHLMAITTTCYTSTQQRVGSMVLHTPEWSFIEVLPRIAWICFIF